MDRFKALLQSRAFCAAALFLTGIAIGVVAGMNYPIEQEQANGEPEDENSAIYGVLVRIWGALETGSNGIVALFTAFLFVVTALLAKYTYNLWRETLRMRKTARKTTRTQLRAYVSVEGEITHLPEIPKMPNAIRCRIILSNSGSTRAKITGIKVAIRERTEEQAFEEPGMNERTFFLAPGGKSVWGRQDFSSLPDPEGDESIFFWGVVFYEDIFKREQETHFRLKSAYVGGQLAIAVCSEGNDAT